MSKKQNFFTTLLKPLVSHAMLTVSLTVAAIAVIGIATWWLADKNKDNSISIGTNQQIDITPTQIQSIKNIGQWSFLTINDEEMIYTVRTGFFSDDQLVRIYYGTLQLGIDMNDTSDEWITRSNDSIVILLPEVRLLDKNFIDEARTRSFMESGKWTSADRHALYRRAQAAMIRRCVTPANLRSAEQQAATQFDELMRAMGFNNVIIRFEKPH